MELDEKQNVCSLVSNYKEFCPSCGSILPLPSTCATVQCNLCNFTTDISSFNNIVSKTRINFNSLDINLSDGNKLSKGKIAGPTVERKCWRCGHNEMTYKTLQTRSADEGQTIFYYCVKCEAQENENS